MYQNRSQIKKKGDCTNEVKLIWINASVNCNISIKISRTVILTVAKSLYGQKFYLTREEAIEMDPSLSSYKEKQLPAHPSKRQKRKRSQCQLHKCKLAVDWTQSACINEYLKKIKMEISINI